MPVKNAVLVIVNATDIDGAPLAVRVENGKLVAVAATLPADAGEPVIDARGGLLLPGLKDHHLHLYATAAARQSVNCGPPEVNNAQALRAALEDALPVTTGWIRGTGYDDSVLANLDRHWLDGVSDTVPMRIQHRSGMLWVMNSPALRLLGVPGEGEELPDGVEHDSSGRLTGRFYNLDAWLGQRLPTSTLSLVPLSAALSACGITAVTDTGVNNDIDQWQSLTAAVASGELQQRVRVMGRASLSHVLEAADGRVTRGEHKLYLREPALPDYNEFVDRIRRSHDAARAVAIHCVTRTELHFALAAIDEAGVLTGDRIEHASVADDDAIEKMAVLGVTAVTQPQFIYERGDRYLNEVDSDDLPLLYRGLGFFKAGAPLAAGSDAPYGGIDPWASMRAAVSRMTREGVSIMAAEAISPKQALGLYLGRPTTPAQPVFRPELHDVADLCLLDCGWRQLRDDLDARHVVATVCNGQISYRRDDPSSPVFSAGAAR